MFDRQSRWHDLEGALLPRLVASAPAGVLCSPADRLDGRDPGSATARTARRSGRPSGSRGFAVWVYDATVPASDASTARVGMSFRVTRQADGWGPTAVTVMPEETGAAVPLPRARRGPHGHRSAQLALTRRGTPWITSRPSTTASRDGAAIAGRPSHPAHAPRAKRGVYVIEALAGKAIARSLAIPYAVTDACLRTAVVEARANRAAVHISWPPAPPIGRGARVSRAPSVGGEVYSYVMTCRRACRVHICATCAARHWTYSVVPMSPWGAMGKAGEAPVAFPPTSTRQQPTFCR